MAASSDDRGNERSGGGGEEPEERTDGWMATYADMVTLLMTFFVLMFALSNADTEKATLFMAAMSRDGITYEQFEEIRDRFNPEEFDTDDEWFIPPKPGDEVSGEHEDAGPGNEALNVLFDAIGNYIEGEGLGSILGVVHNGEFLMLTIHSEIWFASARTEVTPEMIEIAGDIAALLTNIFEPTDPFEITVAGHTDNVPISTPLYPSNWHISRDRAFNFLWELYNRSDLPPGLFSARAYGEYHPIADNDTPEGRQKNRRVEVMISLARQNPLWDNEDVRMTRESGQQQEPTE
jgi:chemotaxis protein MotB